MNQKTTIIPANPGFCFLIKIDDASKEVIELSKKSIIAWKICPENGRVIPIGIDDDADYEFAILTPEGTVIEIGERWFDSIDVYVESLKRKA